ncbi:putative two component transcriptional regulator, receiver domain protein [Variovorax paradoxus B4]|uniref:Putative two component transcriptional regulator, receiver domain protein n=1 Tax=Variovorax paradoxus B4 TaxID=1246301 RepID=T1XM82_VARPD|nr:winged helix-turn-helix domain-containing protein [Variovorax paradoxus]AGU53230.1 putative two component transcriptional regulator, receiver domain protein [Variovorax paradoxus B4]
MGKRFAFGPLLLDARMGTLSRDGRVLAVGQRGLLILRTLLEAQGEVVAKSTLMAAAWPGLVVEDSNLSVQIAALRKLLGTTSEGAQWILTVPRVGYRLAEAAAVDDTALEQADAGSADGGRRPSIAVMPFKNLSDDATQEYFADGVTEDVIAALTRFRWFSVRGRNSSFVYKSRAVEPKTAALELGVRYLLTGAVRRSGDRIRISAELVDACDGRYIWAGHHDFALLDMFEVQDTIAQQVAGSIEPELLKSEAGLAAQRRGSGSVTGWDLVARGSWFFHQVTRPTHLQARALFRQARQLDAGLPEARMWLGRVNAGLIAYGWSEDPDADLAEGLEAALQAVQMDEKSPYAHYALAIVSVYMESFALAIRAAEKAAELSPGFALGHLVLGMARLFSGDAGKAVESLECGLHLNRYDPQNFIWYNVLSLAYLFSGDASEALQCATASLKVRPTWRSAMETAAACCTALGRTPAARQWLDQMTKLPLASGDALQPLWRSNPRWAGELQALLDTTLREAHAEVLAANGHAECERAQGKRTS